MSLRGAELVGLVAAFLAAAFVPQLIRIMRLKYDRHIAGKESTL